MKEGSMKIQKIHVKVETLNPKEISKYNMNNTLIDIEILMKDHQCRVELRFKR